MKEKIKEKVCVFTVLFTSLNDFSISFKNDKY